MHGDCLLMLGSVAMERSTQLSISTGTSVCVCVYVWKKVMQKGRDAFSSILIGFPSLKPCVPLAVFAHCFVNGWLSVTWQFVDPIILCVLCGSMWMYVYAFLDTNPFICHPLIKLSLFTESNGLVNIHALV